MLKHLYLDLETIPAQRPDVMADIREMAQADLDANLAAIKPPGNYKKQETIDEWMATEAPKQAAALRAAFDATVDDAYRKTGLDGAFGQIAVVSFAIDTAEPVKVWNADWQNPEAEEAILQVLSDRLDDAIDPVDYRSTTVIGHNVAAFDLRFLVQRAIVKGIRPHPVIAAASQAKPWENEKVFDTMVQWAGVGQRVKLDKLCKALGITGKGDLDGSKVWDYVKDGRIAEVASYCADDVRRVRSVHQRMTFVTAPAKQFDDVPA